LGLVASSKYPYRAMRLHDGWGTQMVAGANIDRAEKQVLRLPSISQKDNQMGRSLGKTQL